MDYKDRRTALTGESGQISGWLVKLVIFIGLAGILVIEAGGVLVAKGSVAETASGAAAEAAFAIKTRGVREDPEIAARAFTEEKGCEFVSITYDQAAQTVSVTVQRKAKTYIVKHIDFLAKKYAVAKSTSTKSYAP